MFTETLLAEKSIYYSQLKHLPPELDTKLKRVYEKMYGESCSNIMEKFCICVQGAKHSLHMQKKYVWDIKQAVYNYLYLLQLSILD